MKRESGQAIKDVWVRLRWVARLSDACTDIVDLHLVDDIDIDAALPPEHRQRAEFPLEQPGDRHHESR